MLNLRFAFRSLLKSPGFTIVSLLTLALGIGVNTAMFGLVNTLLFKTAPYPDPTRLIRIYRTSPQSQSWPHSAPNLAALRAGAGSFATLTSFTWTNVSFAEPGQPAERIPGLRVGPDFFTTLGVQPALGRAFTAEEQVPGRDRVIVLSHSLWERRFAADPAIIGRNLRIDGEEVSVIGIMPEGFEYPLLWGRIDAWRPLALSAGQLQDRGTNYLNAIGRLRPGVPLARAQAECATLAQRWAREFPDANADNGLRLVELHKSATDETGRTVSLLLLGLAGFVLLIACTNLANLQLARTAARIRDYAIRAALGASRLQLMRELLVESLVLSLAGGVLGLLLAQWVNDSVARRIQIGDITGLAVSLDRPVLLFALLASVATGLLFGLLPAWHAARIDLNTALKQQSRGSTGDRSQHRLRHGLIVAEVALALALLTGAGFFLRGTQRFIHQDTGWNQSGVLIASLSLPASGYGTEDQRRAFCTRALERLANLPGVEHASLSSSLPVYAYNSSRDVIPEGRPLPPAGQTPLAYCTSVSPGFFPTLGIQLLQGRLFTENTGANDPPVLVVNETLARQFWPGENPIGKRIGRANPASPQWAEVIGVVRDVGFAGNIGAPDTRLQAYQPLVKDPWSYLSIALRTSGDPATLTAGLRAAIAGIDPDLPVYNIRTVGQAVERLTHNFTVTNQLLTGFAGLGLLLAALGLYGVISGLVVQRTAEFGIRLALGAQTADVLRLVLGQGLQLALLGCGLGLLGSFGLLQLFAHLVPGLPGQDLMVLAATVLLLLGVAAFACWLPARRASRVDPLVALRAE